WAHLALVSGRNTPIFVQIAAPRAAAMSVDFANQLRRVRWLNKTSAAVSEILNELRPFERIERWHVLSAAVVLLMAFALGSNKHGYEAQFNPKSFRIQTIPALETIKGLRVFTSDQWGDYLIYRFYPDQQGFIDGRSDFYGN